jgi:hypothetical protein
MRGKENESKDSKWWSSFGIILSQLGEYTWSCLAMSVIKIMDLSG